jgi:hypothetical protein
MLPAETNPQLRTQPHKLPHYEHPPLVEVVLGIRWSLAGAVDERAAAGLLERLGPGWQRTRNDPPTHSTVAQSWSRPGVALQSVLGEQRLEICAEGFEFAWNGRQGDVYPHYEAVRDGFVVALDAWNDWLACTRASEPVICGWKVAYLNCIPQGTVWSDLGDCGFFRLLSPTPAGLPHLERCEGHWLFALDRYDAQLACDLSTTSGTARDPRACLWLRLTATGAPGEEEGALLEGLDFGRTTIVRTFRQLMSPAANAYWELARDA